jgi:hypothetical protein
MRTKKLKSRLSRKVIRGGALFSFGAKNTTVFTCDSSEMCEGMDRVGKAITDEKSYPIQVSRGDRKNMYSYFEHSGSIDLLERVANTGLNGIDLKKYKVILKILKSIFYSKGYYEEVEVLRKLEKKTTILPAEQTKIKEYIDRKNLSSILMSYEELYDKIIAMEQDLIARKEKITGRTEEQIQKEIDSKEKALIEKGFYLSAEDAEAANAAPAAVATATTANKAMNKAANSATTANATANATANKAMNSATTAPAVAPAVAPATNPLIKDANSNTNPNGLTRSP